MDRIKPSTFISTRVSESLLNFGCFCTSCLVVVSHNLVLSDLQLGFADLAKLLNNYGLILVRLSIDPSFFFGGGRMVVRLSIYLIFMLSLSNNQCMYASFLFLLFIGSLIPWHVVG